MKLRPLLMKYYNVWAILQGFKTEIRRLANRYKMEARDRAWIKEPWQFLHECSLTKVYKADYTLDEIGLKNWKWKPVLLMPKAASRLILNLTEVRQERLGDINEEGAIAEGVGAFRTPEMIKYGSWPNFKKDGTIQISGVPSALISFTTLWDSIRENDWARDQDRIVWVYRWETFEVKE